MIIIKVWVAIIVNSGAGAGTIVVDNIATRNDCERLVIRWQDKARGGGVCTEVSKVVSK